MPHTGAALYPAPCHSDLKGGCKFIESLRLFLHLRNLQAVFFFHLRDLSIL
jgi:hypothetical protein